MGRGSPDFPVFWKGIVKQPCEVIYAISLSSALGATLSCATSRPSTPSALYVQHWAPSYHLLDHHSGLSPSFLCRGCLNSWWYLCLSMICLPPSSKAILFFPKVMDLHFPLERQLCVLSPTPPHRVAAVPLLWPWQPRPGH